MPPQMVPSEERPHEVSCDVLVAGATGGGDGFSLSPSAQAVDSALDGALSEFLADTGFRAREGDVEVFPTGRRLPCKAIAVVGLGGDEIGPERVRRAAGAAARRLSGRSVLASTLHENGDAGPSAKAAAEGFLLGSYRFTAHKSAPRPAKLDRVLFLGGPDPALLERALAGAEATALARDLTNEPPSLLPPEALARRAAEIADVAGLECNVLEEDDLERAGFGGILGVGRGSANGPRLIELRYSPPGARGKVTLVGKGITFDSGGLSMKDAKSMETMKTDMAGAAAVIATMSALGRAEVATEVAGLVPACENMPGGRALKPGDVIVHYGGRTTEVNNTDAEGRLVLADAIAYASESNPDAIVDIATLTGGILVALGRKASGLFSNDDGLAAEIEAAAAAAGEQVWRMPLLDDLESDLESEVADMKNSAGRYGSAITAALFLRRSVGDGVAWAHLDIAGTARAESDAGEVTKGGTGVATRTLLAWLEGRSR